MDQDPTGGGVRPDSGGASTPDLSGRCVGGSYLLVRPIGRGATGPVWQGVDRASGEPVAVKLLHESLLRQPTLITRLVQECTILQKLRHRHVVRIRDLISAGESLGLVMDLVTGGSLRDHLREQHTLEPAGAARLAAQVAAALAAAHELGVVHRNLEPGTILLHRTGGELETRLTGFGIARVLDTPPRYLAPESCHSATVSPATDIYSLGVLLHEMVGGRPHLAGHPERRPGIPDALWAIITSCLSREPRLRPTAGELVAGLGAVAGAPALPPPADKPRPVPARPAEPVHPSLTGFKLPAPMRRNQPASWRWGRPWATLAVVSAAMLATTAQLLVPVDRPSAPDAVSRSAPAALARGNAFDR